MYRATRLRLLMLALAVIPSCLFAQSTRTGGNPSPVELNISGPRVIHVGDNLQFTATLTNRSAQVIAVPSVGGNGWVYVGGEWWNITRQSGKPVPLKRRSDIPIDNMRVMPTFHDGDFVLLKPGERIEYKRETLGDASDRFLFPGTGAYFVTLSWTFCAPKARHLPDGGTEYSCGVTGELTASVREALLATPSFEVQSNVWKVQLR